MRRADLWGSGRLSASVGHLVKATHPAKSALCGQGGQDGFLASPKNWIASAVLTMCELSQALNQKRRNGNKSTHRVAILAFSLPSFRMLGSLKPLSNARSTIRNNLDSTSNNSTPSSMVSLVLGCNQAMPDSQTSLCCRSCQPPVQQPHAECNVVYGVFQSKANHACALLRIFYHPSCLDKVAQVMSITVRVSFPVPFPHFLYAQHARHREPQDAGSSTQPKTTSAH
eukprot:4446088-Amphidinium_carterae.1